MDSRDRELLDTLQNDLPLVERPFAALGEQIGMPEDELLTRIEGLRQERIVRQMSAIFDTRRLGYQSSLVAARSRDGRSDETAAVFSAHPGVTHNYKRDHAFDIWFTIAVPPNSRLGLDATVDLLGRMADVESIRPLPALKFFKIGVDLDMKGGRNPGAKKARREPVLPTPDPTELEPRDIEAIRALQTDLPARSEPFGEIAEAFGFTVPELLEAGHRYLKTGQMRRFAAVLHHRNAGFVQNGMGVWKVSEEACAEMRPDHGRLPRRLALLPAPDLRGLAVPPVLDDPRSRQGGVRGRARRDLARDRPRRLHRPVLHPGVQEDAAEVLHRGASRPGRPRTRLSSAPRRTRSARRGSPPGQTGPRPPMR